MASNNSFQQLTAMIKIDFETTSKELIAAMGMLQAAQAIYFQKLKAFNAKAKQASNMIRKNPRLRNNQKMSLQANIYETVPNMLRRKRK